MSCGKSLATTHRWLLVDANNHIVGRLASRVAQILMGKHKPTYSPHLDHGDNVVVYNCQGLKLTGNKYEAKRYHWHTGYPGSLRTRSPKYFAEAKGRPEEVLLRAVNGMLPKNRLKQDRLNRLYLSKDQCIPHLDKFPKHVVEQLELQTTPKFPAKVAAPMIPVKHQKRTRPTMEDFQKFAATLMAPKEQV